MKTFTKLIYSENSRYYTIERNVFCSDARRDGFHGCWEERSRNGAKWRVCDFFLQEKIHLVIVALNIDGNRFFNDDRL